MLHTARDVEVGLHLSPENGLATSVAAWKFGVWAIFADVFVHSIQRHALPAVEQALNSSVHADDLAVVSKVPSKDGAAEWVVRADDRKVRAHLVVDRDIASPDNLVTEFVRTLDR